MRISAGRGPIDACEPFESSAEDAHKSDTAIDTGIYCTDAALFMFDFTALHTGPEKS